MLNECKDGRFQSVGMLQIATYDKETKEEIPHWKEKKPYTERVYLILYKERILILIL